MKQKQNINYFEIIVFAFELMWIVRLKSGNVWQA